jgi:thioredoxin reductase
MRERLDVAVVGAGPFGLSVAAQISGRAVRTFGPPMETWRTRMPPDMLLRSDWQETSLSAPGDRGTIDAWAAATGEPRREPIPLQAFLRYAEWFRESFVPESDPARVAALERANGTYRLVTERGDEVDARHVVVAVGVTPFSYAPPPFAEALGEDVTFALDHQDYAAQRGKHVLVVGGGQGALEAAVLAARAGADVELVVRSRLHWFADREPHVPRGPVRRRLYRLAYPVVGYGPPPLNRIVRRPDLFAALPRGLRRRLTARVLRSGGSAWLRDAIDRSVRVSEGAGVRSLERGADGLLLRLTDGSMREADAVILATGFRFSLERLPFLAPGVRARIALEDGWPVLDRYFRSTDPSLLFIGYAAEHRFGPISRFVTGTRFTARRVRRLLGE